MKSLSCLNANVFGFTPGASINDQDPLDYLVKGTTPQAKEPSKSRFSAVIDKIKNFFIELFAPGIACFQSLKN